MGTCVSSSGVRSAATTYKVGPGSNCLTRCGTASAASRVAWAGSREKRESADWMPRADEVWIDLKTGRPTRRLFQFVAEMERRMGGINGASIPQVQQDVTNTQSAVVSTTNFAAQVSQYAQGVAATVQATAQVAVDGGLAGAETIPEVPTAPTRPRVDPYDL